MKPPVFLILGIALAAAGCSGGNSSSAANSAPADSSAAAPASAEPQASAVISSGAAVASDLPVYPGATKSTMMKDMTMTRCGHQVSAQIYDTNADAKTVADWYAGQIPGAIRIEKDNNFGGGMGMTMVELVDPNGARAAAVTQAHFSGAMPDAFKKMGGTTVHISLGTYRPALSSSEIDVAKVLLGSDAAAAKAAMDKVKAKCGTGGAAAGM